MLIASWNVNSIRIRIPQVINWIKDYKPDVLCLQETKVMDNDFPYKSFTDIGYQVKVLGQKSYNGVAILSKSELIDCRMGFEGELVSNENLNQLGDQKRIISALINGIRFINVYVPNGSAIGSEKFNYKIKWLNKLHTYLNNQQKRGEPTCILGDFNIAPSKNDIHDSEKYEGGIMASNIERESLNNALNGKFVDSFRVFEKSNGFWSWWDYRNKAFELNKGWRIDHIYISHDLLPNLKSSVIDSRARGNQQPSDHAPLFINLDFEATSDYFPNDDEDIFEI